MDKRKVILSAAIASLIAAGTSMKTSRAYAGEDQAAAGDKNSCNGKDKTADKNSCKGKDKVAADKNSCKGKTKVAADKNSCKGKNGCSSKTAAATEEK